MMNGLLRTNSCCCAVVVDDRQQAIDHIVRGADLLVRIIEQLGATVTRLARSDTFIPVDTEAVAEPEKLAAWVREHNADALVTACPMCMANVDGRQLYRDGPPIPRPAKPGYEPMPIFYFTELMALAYGLSLNKVLGKHLVDPRPLLKGLGLV